MNWTKVYWTVFCACLPIAHSCGNWSNKWMMKSNDTHHHHHSQPATIVGSFGCTHQPVVSQQGLSLHRHLNHFLISFSSEYDTIWVCHFVFYCHFLFFFFSMAIDFERFEKWLSIVEMDLFNRVLKLIRFSHSIELVIVTFYTCPASVDPFYRFSHFLIISFWYFHFALHHSVNSYECRPILKWCAFIPTWLFVHSFDQVDRMKQVFSARFHLYMAFCHFFFFDISISWLRPCRPFQPPI